MSGYTLGSGATTLISAAQNLTNAWADLGGEIETTGVNEIGVFLEVDINDSANVRARALCKTALAATNEFTLPIKTVGASAVSVEAEYMELNVDADQKILLPFALSRLVPVVQIQIMAGTVGTTAGQIDSAVYTLEF